MNRQSLGGIGRSAYLGDLLALLAGASMPLAFAPYGWSAVAMLSLAVLFRCWLDVRPGRAFWRGWLFGLGMFGLGIAWVQTSVHQFGLPVLAFSVSVTALLVMFMALYPALVGFAAQRWFRISPGASLLVAMPALWALVEWLRDCLFTGFPWLSVGYSQIDGPLAGYAPVGGVFLVGLAVAASAGALASLPGERLRALLTLSAVWGLALALSLVSWTRAEGAPVRVALVQGGIEQSQKWDPEMKDRTLELYRRLSERYWGQAKIIVWPETAIPAFGSEVKDFIAEIDDRAIRSGTDIVLGLPIDDRDGQGRIVNYYNSIIALGSAVSRYDKRHLVVLGEYPPFPSILMPILRSLSIPMSEFSHGAHDQPPLTAAGLKLAPSICFEDAFGEEVIDFLPQSQLLVNVSNDAWFGDSLAPHQHLEIARMRAVETGRYLLRATNNGISAIIDPRGGIAGRSPQFIAHVLAGDVIPRVGATPYVRIGNALLVMLAVALLVIVRLRAPHGE
ncbi:MAG: Apolipoprotein N-acyltransferase [Gammaproteobacteria bacterium]|nr:Apolipoprotein N-acyltransferase [Gammaproteobacteria bacterium]